jgi:hypothetical protein
MWWLGGNVSALMDKVRLPCFRSWAEFLNALLD